ncbi:MAG TPA: ATP-binding protein [Puia sp.]|nr:ATP-binding protein [Puia sp.]
MEPAKNKWSANFNYWAFIASSLFLLSLAIFSLVWFQKEKEAQDSIAHTYEVKLKIEKCFGLLLEAESNQRGYILSNDGAYLKNINHAETLLNTSLNQLDSLVADNEKQIINAGTLRALIFSRVSRLHILLDSFEISNNYPFARFTLPGKLIMDSIHHQVIVMQAEENSLLGQRTFFKKIDNERVITFFVLFSVIAFAILMWSFLKIKKENALRLKAQMEIKNQNEKLERKNHDLTMFANIASHDLKEPLRKIQMFTNLIVEMNPGQLTGKSLGYFEKISQQSSRMQVLIESVLKYAQTEEGNYGFQNTNLHEIAHLAIDNLSEIIKEKNALVRVGYLPTIFCSPTQMEQLFINLIDNGIKYAKPNHTPSIEISTTGSDGIWKIDFRDNGIGFDEAYEKKIFEVFQRLHSGDEYSGTGIGLAICKKIVENHRGTISAKSILGEGSVFSVVLPVKKSATKNLE